MAESAKESKLVSLFNTLKEQDKDIIIELSESLVKRSKNETNKACNTIRSNKSSVRVDEKATASGL